MHGDQRDEDFLTSISHSFGPQLLELFSMKGRHRQKWDYLHELLTERIVYDDTLHRAWFRDDAQSQGLLYACKQAQIELDRPSGAVKVVVHEETKTFFSGAKYSR